uniref:DNA 5'-3' helicase n=1 Tax=Gracilaria salicornia TaxID=172968 RepID=W8DVY8_9FLOR|nr:replicative DNA helicase [Gracilaria salicornia]AHH24541.1 replicative DNA helicase [Gracilaria salicornia]UAD87687.1 replication helicase subunit [Gracilaria salicornia]
MQNIIIDPVLPHNYIAEEILLGTILINPTIFPQLMPFLKSDSFFVESHQLIYNSLVKLHKDKKIDILQLFYFLNDSKILSNVGGVFKIIELMRQSHIFMPSINLYVYVQELMILINNSYMRRLVIQYGYNVIKLAKINDLHCHQIYNKVSEYLESTVHKIPKENLMTFKELIGDLLVKLKYQNWDLVQPTIYQNIILSGFQKLDELIQGFQGGDLIVIAGRPSVGKTSFVINLAFNILSSISLGLCFFSLEMSKVQIVSKFIAIASGVSAQNISFSKLTINEWYILNQICRKLIKYKIYINDTPNMSIDYIEYTAKLLYQETDTIQLVIIDYLQLVQVESFNKSLRTQELGYITRKLKLLAQYLNIPVIVLSQLNRSIEVRLNKQPLLSDLRESGCLVNYYSLNLDIMNNLHIHSFYKYKMSIKNSIMKYFNKNRLCNVLSYALYFNFSLQYSFSIFLLYRLFSLTHNHKLYLKKIWFKLSVYLENTICVLNYSYKLFIYTLEYIYIPFIIYFDYFPVFDLEEPNYTLLFLGNFILHNSIEQDADIVIILSQGDNYLNLSKIIDVSLCKNRNGATGLCQLLFTPQNNKFCDIDS